MVLACIVMIAGGCAGKNDLSPIEMQEQAFEDLRTEIREVIDSPQRANEIITLVDGLEGELQTLREKILARQTRAKQLNANYDTTRAEFEAFFEQVNRDISKELPAATMQFSPSRQPMSGPVYRKHEPGR